MIASEDGTPLVHQLLKATASRAAEIAGSGVTLLFVWLPEEDDGGPPRLRSAAGFGSLDDARAAASELAGAVQTCFQTGGEQQCSALAAMGDRGAAGVRIVAISAGDEIYGALAIGSPDPLSDAATAEIDLLAQGLALQVDHQRLAAENHTLRSSMIETEQTATEKGDEILKLSETLFAQDIELLRNNEKLGQIEKIKSDFIEKMSRELRTPLNSIIESTVSVLAGENESLSEGAKDSLRRALDEGTTYQRTLQNILDLWRIKQGEMAVEIQDVNFAEVIDEAIFSVQDTLNGKPVEIEKRLVEPFPKFKSDLAKVNQILFLLLDNAAKFTDKGTITITARVESGVLRCDISDTGIGICPDDIEYLFDEFFQVDEQASTRYRGAGLGLPLARDLLALLDGRCDVRSEAGQGTVATMELPVG